MKILLPVSFNLQLREFDSKVLADCLSMLGRNGHDTKVDVNFHILKLFPYVSKHKHCDV